MEDQQFEGSISMSPDVLMFNLDRAKEADSTISAAFEKDRISEKAAFDGLLIESFHEKQVPAHHLANLIGWLQHSDFYTAPASSKYHENYEGGLLHHSLKVAQLAVRMYQNQVYTTLGDLIPVSSVLIAALLHDVCKVGYYQQVTKNVKNPETNSWEQKKVYEVKRDRQFYLGHGEQSCMCVLRRVPEIDYQVLEAIRWHMGLWEPSNQMDYSNAFRTNPLVSLIQFADAISVSDWVK